MVLKSRRLGDVMTKNIEVVPYNYAWPDWFEKAAGEIRKTLNDDLLQIHHVGSTAVPNLAAKPIIDIIAVVKSGGGAVSLLESAGFIYKGEFNIPFHYGFSKRGEIKINLHVYEEGHPEIDLNLKFRDFLRSHPEYRTAYSNLKMALLQNPASFEKNNSVFTGYNLGKNAFISKIHELSGFDQLRMVKATHYDEWAFINQHANETEVETGPNHIYLVFTKGIKIIGFVHVEFLEGQKVWIKDQFITEFLEECLERCNAWLKSLGSVLQN